MRVIRVLLLSAFFFSVPLNAQNETPADPVPQRRVPLPVVADMQRAVKVSQVHELADGTPISLRLVKGIQAKTARPGDVAEFVLDHDLWVGDLLVAQAGDPAQAVVVDASKAKWASRGSNLAINITSLQLLDGQVLPLRGVPSYNGGVGPAAQIGSYFVQESLSCPLCEIVFVPIALTALLAPGTNKDVPVETAATAWVDGKVALNVDALRQLQPYGSDTPAKISIVRGMIGGFAKRDLYCNGLPLAHFDWGRRLELELLPGYYRFAINPKKAVVETYLGPGSDTRLITDHDRIYVINEPEKPGKSSRLQAAFAPSRSENTTSLNPFGKQKTEMEYLRKAKPVEVKDLYNNECQPLPVEDTGGSN